MKILSPIMALIIALTFPSFANLALAHSGGTNAQGCHTNHSTGDYHCHTPKTPPPNSVLYCHQVNGESRCGYALSSCNNLVAQYGGRCVRQQ